MCFECLGQPSLRADEVEDLALVLCAGGVACQSMYSYIYIQKYIHT